MIDKDLTYKTLVLSSKEWNDIIVQFEDANIYQTIEFTKFSAGGNNYEHFLLYKNDELISAAIVRIKVLPIINKGVAYIRWSPMFAKNNSQNYEVFELAIKYLHNEYVIKRKLVLRIMSNFSDDNSIVHNVFNKYGFHNFSKKSKSIIIDLTQSEETLLANLRKKWRYSLRQAEKKDLDVKISTDNNAYEIFLKIYREMHSRKNFNEFVDVEAFKSINDLLSEKFKMNIFICYHNNEPVSAMVVSALGKSGIYLLGGSTKKGLELSSSYLLQWEVMKWMKEKGVSFYDLGGIDEVENPGVYTFKSGMGGNEIKYLSGVEAGKNLISKKVVELSSKFLKK